MKHKGFLLAAGVSLAISFTFSACVLNLGNGDGDSSSSGENASSPSGAGGDGNSSSGGGVSSSGGGSSSSGGTNGGGSNDIEYGSFEYGDQTYKTVVIGDQTWMAENLNYEVENSRCYDDDDNNCEIYGRLYNWATAMNFPSTCNSTACSSQVQSNHQGICPDGWHIPSNEDWDKLFRYVDGDEGTTSPYSSSTAGMYLKATSGWNNNGYGFDNYGFAALPGGYVFSNGTSYNVGNNGYWWSASEDAARYANLLRMSYDNANANNYKGGSGSFDKSHSFSIRCVKD